MSFLPTSQLRRPGAALPFASLSRCAGSKRAGILGALAAMTLSACEQAGAGGMRGIAIDPPRSMPAFSFVKADGSELSTAGDGSQATVLFFGYTNCPDFCPTTLSDWARTRRALGERERNIRFVFISVDPARDTPTITQAYASRFDSTVIGVTGAPAMLAAMQTAFGGSSDNIRPVGHTAEHPDIAVAGSALAGSAVAGSAVAGSTVAGSTVGKHDAAPDSTASYTVSHSTETYLLDKQGRLIAVYRAGKTGADALAADLTRLH